MKVLERRTEPNRMMTSAPAIEIRADIIILERLFSFVDKKATFLPLTTAMVITEMVIAVPSAIA